MRKDLAFLLIAVLSGVLFSLALNLSLSALEAERTIVCDAGAESSGEYVDEPGQYGQTTLATCFESDFQGRPVSVYFVD